MASTPKSRDLLGSGSGQEFFGATAYVTKTPRAGDEAGKSLDTGPPRSAKPPPPPRTSEKRSAVAGAAGAVASDKGGGEPDDRALTQRVAARACSDGVQLFQVGVAAAAAQGRPGVGVCLGPAQAQSWRRRRLTPHPPALYPWPQMRTVRQDGDLVVQRRTYVHACAQRSRFAAAV